MKSNLERLKHLLADCFSKRGRVSANKFRAAYLASLIMMIVINALSFLTSGAPSLIIGVFGMALAFFVVGNVATKRHRDTLPLQIPPIYPFRIFSSNPFSNQSGQSGLCAIGLFFMATSQLNLIHLEHTKLFLKFSAVTVFIGGAATFAARYLWVAPSHPGPNQYGPNPHEVSA
ncbi:MAG: DUF805 domain-containing protein [Roseobacter sp.]